MTLNNTKKSKITGKPITTSINIILLICIKTSEPCNHDLLVYKLILNIVIVSMLVLNVIDRVFLNGRVKPMIINLVFATSLSGATCLPTDCYFSELE